MFMTLMIFYVREMIQSGKSSCNLDLVYIDPECITFSKGICGCDCTGIQNLLHTVDQLSSVKVVYMDGDKRNKY